MQFIICECTWNMAEGDAHILMIYYPHPAMLLIRAFIVWERNMFVGLICLALICVRDSAIALGRTAFGY